MTQRGGTLTVAGQPDNPAVLTSWRDTSIGGNSGDGNEPKRGDWNSISLEDGSVANLNHATIRYPSYGIWTNSTQASIANTTVSQCYDAVYVARADLDPGLLWQAGNTATGCHLNGIRFPYGLTPTADTTINTRADWDAVFHNVFVTDGRTLTVPAGHWMKFASSQSLTVQRGGTLTVAGQPDNPAVLTSWRDTSIGGNSGDGNEPKRGDWNGVYVASGGAARMNGTWITYANTALDVADEGEAEIHGKITNSTVGVRATTWVDASNVDWGDPTGPAPYGAGPAIEGDGVFIYPFVGQPKHDPPPADPEPGTAPPSRECKDYMFLAVRGSGEDPYDSSKDSDYDALGGWSGGFGKRVKKVFEGFETELKLIRPNTTYKGIGLRYKAMHVPDKKGMANIWTDAQFAASIGQGVSRISQYIRDERADCDTANQKYVLAGYSQGALAIHLYLHGLAVMGDHETLSRIVGVALAADPAKIPLGDEMVLQNDLSPADGAMVSAAGLYARVGGYPPIPSSATDVTTSLCRKHDIVCAPGWKAGMREHSAYGDEELQGLGEIVALDAIGRAEG